MGKIDCTCRCKPWVFNRSLFTSAKERWECKNSDRNTGKSSAPPCSVPGEDRLANNVANESCRYGKLGQVFTPTEVTVREQYVPIRENESCLCVRVCSTVKWRWNQPRIEQQNGCHEGEQNGVAKNFVRPETVTHAGSLALFPSLLELCFFIHVRGCNSSQIFH